jgi:hypothetical protein
MIIEAFTVPTVLYGAFKLGALSVKLGYAAFHMIPLATSTKLTALAYYCYVL